MRVTNEMQFIGRIGSGGAYVNEEKKFLSFTVCEAYKKEANWLEVTYSFKEIPPFVNRLTQGTLILIKGTPIAKLKKIKEIPVAQLAMFADFIEILFEIPHLKTEQNIKSTDKPL